MFTGMKRRDFMKAALTALPAATLPGGNLFAAISHTGPMTDVEAVTHSGQDLLLRAKDVQDFAARLRGDLLLRTSAGYDGARRAWNGAFDRHPALIARCSGPADVIETVKYAAANNLLLSVRGGGHSLSGQSVCEKGLMLDLSQMNGVRVDPANRVASVEGGALLGALDREAVAHGLITTAGTVSHTGVGGLTLGGGFGRVGRRFGLSCDNTRSYDLITADGKFRRVSAQENKDLFWGLRGGGGNFGVVTSFDFHLHPFDPIVLGGDLMYSWDGIAEKLKFFFEFAAQAPDTLNLDASLVRTPDGGKFMHIDVCYSGPRDKADALLAPLRQKFKPFRDTVAAVPYVVIQASSDESTAHGHKYYIKGGFIQRPTDALIDAMVSAIDDTNLPTVAALAMPQGGGAIARVKPTASAFAQRAAPFNLFVFSRWDDPTVGDRVVEWGRGTWKKLEPHTHGFYVNEFNPEDAARVSTTYGPNYSRMVDLKTQYDPGNLFRLNANVAPRAKQV